jgi:hypothetical protein
MLLFFPVLPDELHPHVASLYSFNRLIHPDFDVFRWYFVRLILIMAKHNLHDSSYLRDLISLVALFFATALKEYILCLQFNKH